MKAKNDESVRRALSKMLGGQADLVQKQVLAAWKDELSQLRQERVMERPREENLLMKGKSHESVRRTLPMMLGG